METTEKHALTLGQEITWRCELRGGYGRIIFVKAKVIKLNPKKCRIEAPLVKGGTKQTNVDYSSIKESDTYTPIVVCGGKKI